MNDTISWLKTIENGYFDNISFSKFINTIVEMQIHGAQIKEMNSKLFLNVVGMKDKKDQYILQKHINRITQYQNDSHQNICGFCTENVINTAIIPCGHQYFCYECSSKQAIVQCPICRQNVKQVLKLFMAGFAH